MHDASVVDFPDPVGPVTSTKPCGISQMFARAGGRRSSSGVGMSSGMARNDNAVAPCEMKQLPRNRCDVSYVNEKSISFSSWSCFRSSAGSMAATVSLHVSVSSTGSPAIARSLPSTRMRGGEYGVSMRSVAPASTTAEIQRSIGWMLIGSAVTACPSLSSIDDPRIDRRNECRLVEGRVRIGPVRTADDRVEQDLAGEELMRTSADNRTADRSRIRVETHGPGNQGVGDAQAATVLEDSREAVARQIHDAGDVHRVVPVRRTADEVTAAGTQ